MSALNQYGDQRIATHSGHGVDIASQRADDLDLLAIGFIHQLVDQKRKAVRALDVGCGFGGQAARLVEAGAFVECMDIEDYSVEIHCQMALCADGHRHRFTQASVLDQPAIGTVHAISCQRMLHYLPYQHAVKALTWMLDILCPGGRLFISASGLNSELGDGYPGKSVPIGERFAFLSDEMAEKHSIHPPVCLYTLDELSTLLSDTGWVVEQGFVSGFGNIKIVAAER